MCMSRILILCAIPLFLVGCAVNSNSPVEELARRDVRKMAVAGRWASIVTDEVLKRTTKLDPRARHIIAGAGGQMIRAVGPMVAKRRLEFASQEDFVESEIRATERAIASQRNQIQQLRGNLTKIRSETGELRRKRSAHEDVSRQAAGLHSKIEGDIESNKAVLVSYQKNIAYLDEVIAMTRREKKQTAPLEAKLNSMIARRAELRSEFRQRQGLGQELQTEKSRIEPLTRGGGARESAPSFNPLSGLHLPNVF